MGKKFSKFAKIYLNVYILFTGNKQKKSKFLLNLGDLSSSLMIHMVPSKLSQGFCVLKENSQIVKKRCLGTLRTKWQNVEENSFKNTNWKI